MRLLELSLQNFMSYKNVTIPLVNLGLLGICGSNLDSTCADSNMSGKSALIEGLVWVYFGQTIRALKDKNEVVNRDLRKDCLVESKFEQDGIVYLIRRTRAHKEFGNNLQIFMGEKEISKGTPTETQKFLSQLIGFEFQSFVNTTVFGQGDAKLFSQATDAERKAMFEKLLDTEVYTRCLQVAKRRIGEVDKELDLITRDGQYSDQQEIDLNGEIAELKIKKSLFQQENVGKIQSLEKELSELPVTDSLEVYKQDEKDLRKQLEGISSAKYKTKEDSSAEIARIKNNSLEEIHQIKDASAKEIRSVKESATEEISADKEASAKEINKLKESIASINTIVTEHIHRKGKLLGLGAKCPTCEEEVKKERIERIISGLDTELATMNSQLHMAKQQIASLEIARNDHVISLETAAKKKIRSLETAVDGKVVSLEHILDENIGSLGTASEEKLREFEENEMSIRISIEQVVQKLGTATFIANKRESLNKEIAGLKDAKEPYSELISSRADQLKLVVSKKLEKTALRKSKAKLLDDLKFWEKGYGLKGIKSLILEDIIPFLNEKLEFYTRFLTNSEINVEIDPTSELKSGDVADKMKLVITSALGKVYSYESSSGGERRRIDACLLFALHDLAQQRANKVNVLFVDEMFDILDELGVEKLIGLLWKKQQESTLESILVISHNKSILSSLPASIEVVKKSGYSDIRLPQRVEDVQVG